MNLKTHALGRREESEKQCLPKISVHQTVKIGKAGEQEWNKAFGFPQSHVDFVDVPTYGCCSQQDSNKYEVAALLEQGSQSLPA